MHRKCTSLPERFWPKVRILDLFSCWEWQAAVNEKGYGVIGLGGRGSGNILAHRLSWIFHFGPIPDNLRVLHTCDNPPCVNPAHLFVGTPHDNTMDMVSKDRHHRGERNNFCKLSSAQVFEIRLRVDKGELQSEIAKDYGITPSTVSDIKLGDSWKHLFPETPVETRRDKLGERNRMAKLTAADIPIIRKRYEDGESTTSIGKSYGVQQGTIYPIVHRRTWKHIP